MKRRSPFSILEQLLETFFSSWLDIVKLCIVDYGMVAVNCANLLM